MKRTINIALFASGTGTNVENIFKYFQKNENIRIKCVLCNNKNAYVLQRAKNLELESLLFDRIMYNDEKLILNYLKIREIDFIILAGFLWLIPEYLINQFPNKIINIHPALLPKYGGKGMFGENVHKAVLENHETITGITVHYVNKNYDEGSIIAQKTVEITKEDTIETIAEKIHILEQKYFPQIIENIL
ncbi:MAG: phosphoribosylglycinamide formyltransferase [Bacteroidales bacterium]|jgi:phosphoribosylglycinamide formyltransferase-1|nr:phosphoribosylglycinamide formyltransferase [Bacteroidales bacterium]